MQCLQTLCGHTRDVTSVICWDNYLLLASLDKTLKVWAATESGTIEVVHETQEDHVSALVSSIMLNILQLHLVDPCMYFVDQFL